MNFSNINSTQGKYTNPQIEAAYQDLIKNYSGAPFNTFRTVFNDITDEWNNCSEDERKFIESDTSYIDANVQYSQQFNAFLLDQFGLQFINSKYGKSAEKVYLAMKEAKSKFKNSTLEDVTKIKNENIKLQQQLQELEKMLTQKTLPSAKNVENIQSEVF